MTGKGVRMNPGTEYDKTRGNVALAKLGNALGVKLESDQSDHVLLEQLAARVPFALKEYYDKGRDDESDARVDCSEHGAAFNAAPKEIAIDLSYDVLGDSVPDLCCVDCSERDAATGDE